MKVLQLTQGKYTFVDDEDYEPLWKIGRWFFAQKYATTHSRKEHPWPTGKSIRLHRVVMEWAGLLEDGKDVDHIDNNPLNNQKHNLRMATRSQNQWNQQPVRGGSSQYKGVSWQKKCGKWHAYININKNKRRHIGLFENETDAAKAYDEAAREYYGEFAKLNFPL